MSDGISNQIQTHQRKFPANVLYCRQGVIGLSDGLSGKCRVLTSKMRGRHESKDRISNAIALVSRKALLYGKNGN